MEIDQLGSFEINVMVISDSEKLDLRSLITLDAEGYLLTRLQLEFDVYVSEARVALDISHSPWWLDSIYGQFKELYIELTQLNVAVEEISDPTDITPNKLQGYDAILILDPCARDYDLYGRGRNKSYPYSPEEINAYENYWKTGGNLMVVTLDNRTIDIASVNDLISWSNISLNFDKIPSVQVTVNNRPLTRVVTEMLDHPITTSVSSFDFIGCSLNFTGDCFSLAWTLENEDGVILNKTVMVGLEGDVDNRLIVTGSNYFMDNAGMKGLYSSDYNARLVKQCVLWLIGL
jgi:hypothetical protein